MRSIGCQGLVGLGNCLHAVLARNLSLLFLCHFFAIPRALDGYHNAFIKIQKVACCFCCLGVTLVMFFAAVTISIGVEKRTATRARQVPEIVSTTVDNIRQGNRFSSHIHQERVLLLGHCVVSYFWYVLV